MQYRSGWFWMGLLVSIVLLMTIGYEKFSFSDREKPHMMQSVENTDLNNTWKIPLHDVIPKEVNPIVVVKTSQSTDENKELNQTSDIEIITPLVDLEIPKKNGRKEYDKHHAVFDFERNVMLLGGTVQSTKNYLIDRIQKIKIRVKEYGGIARAKVLIADKGKHIRKVAAFIGNKAVFLMYAGKCISDDAELSFRFYGKRGEQLHVLYEDDKGRWFYGNKKIK